MATAANRVGVLAALYAARPASALTREQLEPGRAPDPAPAKTRTRSRRPPSRRSASIVVGRDHRLAGHLRAVRRTGNVDGTQNPTHILMYACITDASGNVTLGSSVAAGAGEWGQTQKGAPAYASGEFSCVDLVGLDAGAVTKLGRLIQGTVSSGRVLIYGP
jgi:hypothetical protein